MDSGKIVEEGTHQELIKLGGNYHKLIQLQGFSKDKTAESESTASAVVNGFIE